MTKDQILYIKDNFSDEVDTYINEKIDNELIYYSDIEDRIREFSNILDVLRGEYTLDDLWNDLLVEFYNDDDTFEEVYNDSLDDDQRAEVDALEQDDEEEDDDETDK